jgi:hypothetical protein
MPKWKGGSLEATTANRKWVISSSSSCTVSFLNHMGEPEADSTGKAEM